jgi:hypothetical protein
MLKVLLAGGDEIVNVPLVLAHLKEFRAAHDKEQHQSEGTGSMIAEVVVKPELDHAEVVVSSSGVYNVLCNIRLVALSRNCFHSTCFYSLRARTGMDAALGMLADSMHALRQHEN